MDIGTATPFKDGYSLQCIRDDDPASGQACEMQASIDIDDP
jgi:hypothetical protein